jgi:N-acetylmuramoyl-L-alanine amidase
MNLKWKGCAPRNFRTGRPAGIEIEAVVIHLIDGSLAGADATFLDNTLANPRSAHYAVGRSGVVHHYVKEEDAAYHAGVLKDPTWTSLKKDANGRYINPNYYTIGIEHEGRPNDDWTDEMYASSAELLRRMAASYPGLQPLSRSNVVMHREIRADTSCPGFKADLDRLIREAVAVAAPPAGENPAVITTITAVNLRANRPAVSAPVVRVIPAQTLVHVVGSVTGDSVLDHRNKPVCKWFQTLDGEYIWAGATDNPD